MKQQNFVSLLRSKASFLLATYLTLIAELFITFAIVYWFRDHPKLSRATKQSALLYFVLMIGLILILGFINMPIWLQITLFTVYAIVMGAWLHHVTALIPKELIDAALKGAIGVFVGMTVIGVILASMGINLGWLALILLAALIGLVLAWLIVRLFLENSKEARKYLFTVGLVLFSIYVLFSTNMILQKEYSENFVMAAIDFYLSFVNLFSSLLGLGME